MDADRPPLVDSFLEWSRQAGELDVGTVFGMIEYGRMVMVYQVLTNASREGARAAVLDGATTTSVTTAVNSYLSAAAVSGLSPPDS